MSEVKVNKITPTTNCGTVTLGDSGDTLAIPCGVTLSNAGSITNSGTITNTGTISGGTITGTIDNQVNWDTTAKTAGFTAVAGNGYFVNTTSGAITVTLPASPSAGDLVGIKDYANTADTNNITIARNGENIQGVANDFLINTEGASVTLFYVDGTQGWVTVSDSIPTDVQTFEYVAATGGTITTCGDFKIHTFTGPGTFTVTNAGNSLGSNSVDYLVVAGGGAGGSNNPGPGSHGGGGGAGGLRIGAVCAPSAPPLVTTALPVTATGYPITVGGGGSPQTGNPGTQGSNSVFSTITSTGGGFGGAGGPSPTSPRVGGDGGSGGGSRDTIAGGSGNTPPVSPPQGNDGGAGPYGGGGGAGSTGKGTPQVPSPAPGNASAGDGFPVASVFGAAPQPFYLPDSPNVGVTACGTFAGGGGSGFGGTDATSRAGGPGGGGQSGTRVPAGNPAPAGTAGRTNSGGGGGAVGSHPDAGPGGSGGAGGSGIVIIRYKFQ